MKKRDRYIKKNSNDFSGLKISADADNQDSGRIGQPMILRHS